jgi:elongation factor Ts
MAAITAALVKELRDETNLGMMDCKRALAETDGDKDAAIRILRERGLAMVAKRASKAANQGVVASRVSEDGNVAAMVEVNCETDFVARNDDFVAFVDTIADKALSAETGTLADAEADTITAKTAEVGEKIVIRRNELFKLEGTGKVGTYIHAGGKIGVLIEVGCGKAESAETPAYEVLLKDLAMHVAASNPPYMTVEEIPEDVLAAERDICAKQVEGKPAEIVDKIVDGKMKKYYAEVCFLLQGFIKEPKQSITDVIDAAAKELGDEISVKRYVRYQLGA